MKQFIQRVPDKLGEAITNEAKERGQSRNSLINEILNSFVESELKKGNIPVLRVRSPLVCVDDRADGILHKILQSRERN